MDTTEALLVAFLAGLAVRYVDSLSAWLGAAVTAAAAFVVSLCRGLEVRPLGSTFGGSFRAPAIVRRDGSGDPVPQRAGDVI